MLIRRIVHFSCKLGILPLILAPWRPMLIAQPQQTNQSQVTRTDSAIHSAPAGEGYTFHVTTREVVVEVVARDHRNHPVTDLDRTEFSIFEGTGKSKADPKTISGFRTIDPSSEGFNSYDASGSVVLPLGGRCEIRYTVHYEIAFHPTNWTSGYHSIVVTTTRPHVALSYRTQYYVGVTDIPANAAQREAREIDSGLMNAACYHSRVPASLLLSAKKMESRAPSEFRYSVKLLPASLESAGMREDTHRVQLDYGVCTFSRSGRVIGYWHFSEDRSLNPADISAILSDGLQEFVEVPDRGNPSLVRFVVLEPKSGNLGTIDVFTSVHAPSNEAEDSGPKDATHVLLATEDVGIARAARGSLGSTVPKAGALCGDVYELPNTTSLLPRDFRVLNAVGAVYTNSLDVPEQILGQGIPGSTPRSEWFGIDYYGEFWVPRPGKYLFVLNADDGADLYIDDHMLISDDGIHPPRTVSKSITLEAGKHTIHLPYFQGPTYVNLILQIKPPGEHLKVFNLRAFSDPYPHASSRH